MVVWMLWKERNNRVFQRVAAVASELCHQIMSEVGLWKISGAVGLTHIWHQRLGLSQGAVSSWYLCGGPPVPAPFVVLQQPVNELCIVCSPSSNTSTHKSFACSQKKILYFQYPYNRVLRFPKQCNGKRSASNHCYLTRTCSEKVEVFRIVC